MRLPLFKSLMFLLCLSLLLILSPFIFAQTDTTGTGTDPGNPLFGKISMWIAIIVAIYEALVRVIPTTVNLSIFDLIIKILKSIGSILPNKATHQAKVVEVKGPVTEGLQGAQGLHGESKPVKLIHKV